VCREAEHKAPAFELHLILKQVSNKDSSTNDCILDIGYIFKVLIARNFCLFLVAIAFSLIFQLQWPFDRTIE